MPLSDATKVPTVDAYVVDLRKILAPDDLLNKEIKFRVTELGALTTQGRATTDGSNAICGPITISADVRSILSLYVDESKLIGEWLI